NHALDLQTLFEDFSVAGGIKLDVPFEFSYVRATIDPTTPVAFLMGFRDPDLNVQKQVKLDYFRDACSDPPAWWLLKRKKTRDWTGSISVESTRVDMANLLSPINSAEFIKRHEPNFADIKAFILTVESPKYPFAIDEKRAAQGKELFADNCAKCHGTYGDKRSYPNKVVPLDKIGTDPLLAETFTERNGEFFNRSWFGQEPG